MNEFNIPFSDSTEPAFLASLEETIAGPHESLLVEWTNGDNLMVNHGGPGQLVFAFYSGYIQRWEVSTASARVIAASMVGDRSHNCSQTRGQCEAHGVVLLDAAAHVELEEDALKCA